MKIKFKENKILTKENFPEILQKALKNISNYEMSEFEFEKEWQTAYIKYIEEVVEQIIKGLSLKLNVDPDKINKSYKFSKLTLIKAYNNEIDEDSLLLKSLWQKLKEKYTKAINIFKKFLFNNGKPLEPMKIEGNLNYNPETMKILKDDQWNNIENGVVDYLKNTLSKPNEELTIKAGMFGLLRKKMDDEGIPIDKQKKMSFDDLVEKFGTDINDTKKIEKEISNRRYLKQSIEYAKNHAAEFLSIKDGELKNKLVSMIKKQIVGGLEDGISKQEMISRLYWIDPENELGKRFSNDTIQAFNRDWRRIAITEFSNAENNGYLASHKDGSEKGEKLYFVFDGQYNPKEKANRPCNSFLGKIGLLVDTPQSSEKTNDKFADYKIWEGKNNVGRKESEWWFCISVHPHCTHFWTRINPQTQQYNDEIGKIEYKTIEKSGCSLDNVEWKNNKAKFVKEILPEFVKKIKKELKIEFPIIVRLYKEHEKGPDIRSLHDEGIIILYESTPDWKGDLLHEIGHLYYHLMKIEENKNITNHLNKTKEKLEKEKQFNRIFENEHTYKNVKEIFATIFKWYISGKIIDKMFLDVMERYLPGNLEFLNSIFNGNLKKSEFKEFDLLKNDKTKLKINYEGIPINIEWMKGETRSYPGSPWKNPMIRHSYGYIKNTDSPDREDLDVYIHDPIKKNAPIYMLNQLHTGDKFDKEFDEHKFMIGYPSKKAAKEAYIETMQKEMFGGLTKISLENFKKNILPFYKK